MGDGNRQVGEMTINAERTVTYPDRARGQAQARKDLAQGLDSSQVYRDAAARAAYWTAYATECFNAGAREGADTNGS